MVFQWAFFLWQIFHIWIKERASSFYFKLTHKISLEIVSLYTRLLLNDFLERIKGKRIFNEKAENNFHF
jgi:hypothetical protein